MAARKEGLEGEGGWRGAGTPIADTGEGGAGGEGWPSRREESHSYRMDEKRRHSQKRFGMALISSRLVLNLSSFLIKGFCVLGRP